MIFTGFPAGTVQIRGHEQLQQKSPIFLSCWHRKWTSPAIILVGLKCHHEKHLGKPRQGKARGRFLLDLPSWRMRDGRSRSAMPRRRRLFCIFLPLKRAPVAIFSSTLLIYRSNPRARAIAAEKFQFFCPGGIANGHH